MHGIAFEHKNESKIAKDNGKSEKYKSFLLYRRTFKMKMECNTA